MEGACGRREEGGAQRPSWHHPGAEEDGGRRNANTQSVTTYTRGGWRRRVEGGGTPIHKASPSARS